MKRFTIALAVFIASCGGSNDSLTPNSDGSQSPSNDGSLSDPVTEGATINRDNHSEILTEVFKVYTGQAFADRLQSIPVQTDQFGIPDIDDGSITSNSCDNGGTVSIAVIADIRSYTTELNFQDCQTGEILLNGDYIYTEGDEETFLSSSNSLNANFDGDTTVEFSGSAGFSCCQSSISYTSSSALNYNYSSAAERFKITSATTYFSDGEDVSSDTRKASMTGNFMLETPVSGSSALTVAVDTDFFFESESGLSFEEAELLASTWTFDSGSLKVTAEDGSTLILDADSGDSTTAKITIENADGIETFDQPWSVWSEVLNSSSREIL